MSFRVGFGIDRHRLVGNRPLVLGGIRLEHDQGLEGHSDADVIVHALCDALLGAAALGDLGALFPDQDPAHQDRDSVEFLEIVVAKLRAEGLQTQNVDVTVMAEQPRLAPHVAAMRARLAAALGVDVAGVSIKATRGEGLGPEGRQEAITAYAVALVEVGGDRP